MTGIRNLMYEDHVVVGPNTSVADAQGRMMDAGCPILLVATADGEAIDRFVRWDALLTAAGSAPVSSVQTEPVTVMFFGDVGIAELWAYFEATGLAAGVYWDQQRSRAGLFFADDVQRWALGRAVQRNRMVILPPAERRPLSVVFAGKLATDVDLEKIVPTGLFEAARVPEIDGEILDDVCAADVVVIDESEPDAIDLVLVLIHRGSCRVLCVGDGGGTALYSDLAREHPRRVSVQSVPAGRWPEYVGNYLRSVATFCCLDRMYRNLLLLYSAADSSSAGITITSPEGQILFSNTSDAAMHGYRSAELKGEHISVFAVPATIAPLKPDDIKRLSRAPKLSWNRRKDGSSFPVRLRSSPVVTPDGELLGKICVCEDLSEREAIRLEATRNRVYFEHLLNLTSEGVVIRDHAGYVTHANDVFLQFFALSRDEVVGRHSSDVFNADVYGFDCVHLLEDGRVKNREMTIQRPGGGHLSLLLNIHSVYGGEAYRPSTVCMLRDVTEIKRLRQAEERKAEVNNLGDVLAAIRHEIGNPLNTITNTAHLIREKARTSGQDGSLLEYCQWIIDESRRIEYLLASMREYALFDQVSPTDVPFLEFLNSTIGILSAQYQEENVSIDAYVEYDPGIVTTDPYALHHVLANIVCNAVEAGVGRRDTVVAIRTRSLDDVFFCVEIADNGPGIPAHLYDDIWKPFVSSKRRGSGLGLAIVKKILAKLDYDIDCESPETGGAIFRIFIRKQTSP